MLSMQHDIRIENAFAHPLATDSALSELAWHLDNLNRLFINVFLGPSHLFFVFLAETAHAHMFNQFKLPPSCIKTPLNLILGKLAASGTRAWAMAINIWNCGTNFVTCHALLSFTCSRTVSSRDVSESFKLLHHQWYEIRENAEWANLKRVPVLLSSRCAFDWCPSPLYSLPTPNVWSVG